MSAPDIQIIIHDLLGTCQSLDEVCRKHGMEGEDALTEGAHDAIDAEIFRCSFCSWWCECFEGSDDDEPVCEDCQE